MIDGLRLKFTKEQLIAHCDRIIAEDHAQIDKYQNQLKKTRSNIVNDERADREIKELECFITNTSNQIDFFGLIKNHLHDEEYSLSIDDMKAINIVF